MFRKIGLLEKWARRLALGSTLFFYAFARKNKVSLTVSSLIFQVTKLSSSLFDQVPQQILELENL